MTLQSIEILARQAEAKGRQYIQQRAYQRLSHVAWLEVDDVAWDAPAPRWSAGPAIPEAIVGCVVLGKLRIRWERQLGDKQTILWASEAIDDLDFSPAWLQDIIAYKHWPRCLTGAEDVARFHWEVSRHGTPVYSYQDGELVLPVIVIGERQ